MARCEIDVMISIKLVHLFCKNNSIVYTNMGFRGKTVVLKTDNICGVIHFEMIFEVS